MNNNNYLDILKQIVQKLTDQATGQKTGQDVVSPVSYPLTDPQNMFNAQQQQAFDQAAQQEVSTPQATPTPMVLQYPQWMANAPAQQKQQAPQQIDQDKVKMILDALKSAPSAIQQGISNIGGSVGSASSGTWDDVVNAAKKVSSETGMPLAVMLGQAYQETGGKSQNAPGNNWFGMKGRGTAGTNQLATQEYGNKGYYGITAGFGAYNNPEDSARAYADLIRNDPRYAKAWAVRNDPEKMIEEIHKAGYATSPTYAENVKNNPAFKQYKNVSVNKAPATPKASIPNLNKNPNVVSPLPPQAFLLKNLGGAHV